MKSNINSVNALINCFTKLPGVGFKTAERYAYSVINGTAEDAQAFSNAIMNAKANVRFCSVCGNFTDSNTCDVCDSRSSATVICVVSYPKDVIAIEKSGGFKGKYHVLHGALSPLENKGVDDLNLKSLMQRLNNEKVTEVIVATNPDVTGEATATLIAHLIKPLSIKVTRLAQGLSLGTNLEYADEVTLSRAITNRTEL
ncbi:MAG: recombination mediator RecR [Firmicutes bacterium]|nr:recombination mediator RecR [Bacillota bacterium]